MAEASFNYQNNSIHANQPLNKRMEHSQLTVSKPNNSSLTGRDSMAYLIDLKLTHNIIQLNLEW